MAVGEILAELKKFWNGKEMNTPLEIVIGTGTRPGFSFPWVPRRKRLPGAGAARA